MSFNRRYAIATISIFVIELLIALFVRDRFVRPYVGDTLATILVYCAIRSVTATRMGLAILAAMMISYGIEFLQYVHIIDKVGVQSGVVRVVLGTSAAWEDVAAYTIGGLLVVALEYVRGDVSLKRVRIGEEYGNVKNR